MERKNQDYKKRNMDFRDRRVDFRNAIDTMKIEDRQSKYDKIHEANIQNGWDKNSTLRKVSY